MINTHSDIHNDHNDISTKRKKNNDKCRDKGPKSYIGPWALAEDVDWSEDE